VSRSFENSNVLTKLILIIDDDDHVRSTLAAILVQAGYRVFSAGHINKALEYLSAERCDLVLLDLKMPGMDSLALAAKIEIAYPELPVVILTAYPSPKLNDGTEIQGVRAYFTKPVDPVLLLNCVKDILSEPSSQNNRLLVPWNTTRK